MGREIKKVSLDFAWPLEKPWGGYINPYFSQTTHCPHCKNGYSKIANELQEKWYGNGEFKPEDNGSTPITVEHPYIVALAERNCNRWATIEFEKIRLRDMFNARWMHHLNQEEVNVLCEEGRLMDFTHTWKLGDGWKEKSPKYVPTAKEVNDWSLQGMGHDSTNCYIVVKHACEKLGVSSVCYHCNGEVTVWPSKEIKELSESWKQTEPPKGEGYQLWETVSEGSPISPVFEKAEDLANWLMSDEYTWDKETSYEQWMKFILGDGWGPSMVMIDGKLMTGVNV